MFARILSPHPLPATCATPHRSPAHALARLTVAEELDAEFYRKGVATAQIHAFVTRDLSRSPLARSRLLVPGSVLLSYPAEVEAGMPFAQVVLPDYTVLMITGIDASAGQVKIRRAGTHLTLAGGEIAEALSCCVGLNVVRRVVEVAREEHGRKFPWLLDADAIVVSALRTTRAAK